MARFESLIIVSHGRGGSKLLQGLLNTAPGFLIRGENLSFLEGFQLAYDRLAAARAKPFAKKSDAPSHPFYGIGAFDMGNFLADLRTAVRHMLVPPELRDTVACFGFKEIRFPLTNPDFADYMAFLRALLPNLAIVVNTRAHEDIANSGWWPDRPLARVLKTLAAADDVRLQYVAAHPDHAFHIRYEDICSGGAELVALFESLGAPFVRESVEATLATLHGSGNLRRQQKSLDTEADEDGHDIAAPKRDWGRKRLAQWAATRGEAE